MQITGLRTEQVEIPFETPIRTSIHQVDSVGCVLLFVDTDAGLTGEGLVWSLGVRRLLTLDALIKSMEVKVLGRDPHEHTGLWAELWADINFFGHKGMTLFAIAAIDMALWDLVGKANNLSVCRLLGQCRDRVKAYNSSGLWVSMSIDELQAQARDFLAQGYHAMKCV